jgi:hypothetical protein
MQIDVADGFQAEFGGHTFALYPTGDGTVAEVVISSRDTSKHSERASTITSRTIGRDDRPDDCEHDEQKKPDKRLPVSYKKSNLKRNERDDMVFGA